MTDVFVELSESNIKFQANEWKCLNFAVKLILFKRKKYYGEWVKISVKFHKYV